MTKDEFFSWLRDLTTKQDLVRSKTIRDKLSEITPPDDPSPEQWKGYVVRPLRLKTLWGRE